MYKTIVIMAAGMGSRYGGLKQIDAMGPSGEILMEYSVYDALQAGFDRVVFIIKDSMHKDFHEKIAKRLSKDIEVDYAFQRLEDLPQGFSVPLGREKPWGTSQAILAAKEKITTPFAVFNADDFYGREAFNQMASYLDSLEGENFQASMVGYKVRNTLSAHGTVTRGICQTREGFLSAVREIDKVGFDVHGSVINYQGDLSESLTGDELCSMNFWGFTPHLFNFLQKDFSRFLKEKGQEMKSEWLLPVTVDDMIQAKATRVKVLQSGDSWFGVTYPEDKPLVSEKIKKLVDRGSYPTPLFPEVCK
jgi:NDP-sugar pyrophosphorylase family protein